MNAEIGSTAVATKPSRVSVMSSPRLEMKSVIPGPKLSSRESTPSRPGMLDIKSLGTFIPPRESSRQEQSVPRFKGFTAQFKPLSVPEKPKMNRPNTFASEWYSPNSQKSRNVESTQSSFNTKNRERLGNTTKKIDVPFGIKKENKVALKNWNTTDSLKIKQVREALRDIANPKTVVPDVVVKKPLSQQTLSELRLPAYNVSKKLNLRVGTGEFSGKLPPLKKLSFESPKIATNEVVRNTAALPVERKQQPEVKLSVPNITPKLLPEIRPTVSKEYAVRMEEKPVVVTAEKKSVTDMPIIQPGEQQTPKIKIFTQPRSETTKQIFSPLVQRVSEMPTQIQKVLILDAAEESALRKEVKAQINTSRNRMNLVFPTKINELQTQMVDTPLQKITTKSVESMKKKMKVADLALAQEVLEEMLEKKKKKKNLGHGNSPETVVFMIKEKQRQAEICFAEDLNPLVTLLKIGTEAVNGKEKNKVVAQGIVSEAKDTAHYKPLELTGHVPEGAICRQCVGMLQEQKRTLKV